MQISPYLYPVYAILNLAVLFWAIWMWRKLGRWQTFLVALVAFGLVWDNLVLSLGIGLREGPLLYALSLPRYWLHQLFLPWIIVVSYCQARDLGLRWALNKWGLWAAIFLAGAVMIIGILTRLVGVNYVPAEVDGITRYIAEGVKGPPVVSIVSIGFVLVVSGFFIKAFRWPWLFLASLLVFLGEGAPLELIRRLVGSGLEVIWMAALILAEQLAEKTKTRNKS